MKNNCDCAECTELKRQLEEAEKTLAETKQSRDDYKRKWEKARRRTARNEIE